MCVSLVNGHVFLKDPVPCEELSLPFLHFLQHIKVYRGTFGLDIGSVTTDCTELPDKSV